MRPQDNYFAEPLTALLGGGLQGTLRLELWGVLKSGRTQLRIRLPRDDGGADAPDERSQRSQEQPQSQPGEASAGAGAVAKKPSPFALAAAQRHAAAATLKAAEERAAELAAQRKAVEEGLKKVRHACLPCPAAASPVPAPRLQLACTSPPFACSRAPLLHLACILAGAQAAGEAQGGHGPRAARPEGGGPAAGTSWLLAVRAHAPPSHPNAILSRRSRIWRHLKRRRRQMWRRPGRPSTRLAAAYWTAAAVAALAAVAAAAVARATAAPVARRWRR